MVLCDAKTQGAEVGTSSVETREEAAQALQGTRLPPPTTLPAGRPGAMFQRHLCMGAVTKLEPAAPPTPRGSAPELSRSS